MSQSHSAETRTAALAGLSGYLLWGLAPLYFQALDFASAAEIVLHRVVWAVPLLLGALYFGGRLGPAFEAIKDRRTLLTLLATATLISVNWWVFVFAVNSGNVLQASLGYYINPLVSVALGVAILREPLGPFRIAAIVLAAIGVINQVVAVGEMPWISLVLAFSFAAYGYLRKIASVDGRIGLFWETVFILPVAISGVIWLEASGGGNFLVSPGHSLLLMAAGAVTVVPLLLYIIGARGLRLSTMGVLQFIAPSLQFAIGVATGETFTVSHMVTFGFIWAGVVVFIYSQMRRERRGQPAPLAPGK